MGLLWEQEKKAKKGKNHMRPEQKLGRSDVEQLKEKVSEKSEANIIFPGKSAKHADGAHAWREHTWWVIY